MARYNPKESEPKWRKAWADADVFRASETSDRPKYFVMEMFPYPSGRLHVGHARNYAMGDVVARFKRARGYNVLHPMGWDAFGLPAENAAAERGVDPAGWTYDNIAVMREELQRLGVSIDWSREFATCDPAFYRWTQWIFLELFKHGLAYRKDAIVKWCPNDQTVLANEQVVDGRCERSGDAVERRDLEQWYLRITDYAQQLLDDLDQVEWPQRVVTQQRNWIGRSEGAEFDLAVCDESGTPTGGSFRVFTTRPDTSFGMTFCVLAPEHPLVADIVTACLRICGMSGYRNDGKYSVTRHLRDAHSAALMIGNERIHASNAALHLVHKDD